MRVSYTSYSPSASSRGKGGRTYCDEIGFVHFLLGGDIAQRERNSMLASFCESFFVAQLYPGWDGLEQGRYPSLPYLASNGAVLPEKSVRRTGSTGTQPCPGWGEMGLNWTRFSNRHRPA